jgi:nucleotide-binding universal stress UspA family protein
MIVMELRSSRQWLNRLKVAFSCWAADHMRCGAILLSRRGVRSRYRRILVPVTFSSSSLEAARTAMRLCGGTQVTFLHAFHAPGEAATMSGLQGLSLRRAAREAAVSRIRALAACLDNRDALVSYAVQYGPADAVTCAYANRYQADLIVLGPDHAGAPWGQWTGKAERRLVEQTSSDLLIVGNARAS